MMGVNVPSGRYWEPACEESELWMPETEEELAECYAEASKNDELPFV